MTMTFRGPALAAAIALAAPAAADSLGPPDTGAVIADCRVLADRGDDDTLSGDDLAAAERCHLVLEGFHGAAMLITPEWYPLTQPLGYCMPPDATTQRLAVALTEHVAADPDCARLAHFSMCLNAAFAAAYADGC